MCRIKECFVQGEMGTDKVFLTSGFQPPTNADLVDRAHVSAAMQGFASGGSIEHVFLGGKMSQAMKKHLIDKLFEKPLTYMTLSPIVSICNSCGTKEVGEHFTCSHCGDDSNMMIYARVIGYVRPIVSGKVKIEESTINGTENYWQDARRLDWVERHKL